jgi:hypothetical protein
MTTTKVSKNGNMHKAKAEKNDEFYTQLSDIEKELNYYKDHFRGKVVYCNCDDPEWSNFFKYFSLNFEFLGLKKLITTHYGSDKKSYKLEITGDTNGDGKINQFDTVKTELNGNGDFSSPECIEMLNLCDLSWNQILPSLMCMYAKLRLLGFEYQNHKIVLIEPTTEPSSYHGK